MQSLIQHTWVYAYVYVCVCVCVYVCAGIHFLMQSKLMHAFRCCQCVRSATVKGKLLSNVLLLFNWSSGVEAGYGTFSIILHKNTYFDIQFILTKYIRSSATQPQHQDLTSKGMPCLSIQYINDQCWKSVHLIIYIAANDSQGTNNIFRCRNPQALLHKQLRQYTWPSLFLSNDMLHKIKIL